MIDKTMLTIINNNARNANIKVVDGRSYSGSCLISSSGSLESIFNNVNA